MAERGSTVVPTPTAEQRRVTIENFERAKQVLQSGNHDYAIQMLALCCRIDPSNLQFRQALRRAQKDKYGNNLRGSRFAFFSTPRFKARVKSAKMKRDWLKVLEYAEDVFYRNPWDLSTSMVMAEAFESLGLLDLAVYTLDQARQKYEKDATLNRALARLFERRGEFTKAIVLWQIVQKSHPADVEAANKSKDLAASETIARGGYEKVASGTKESPAIGKMETASAEKQDKSSKDIAALLKRIEADPTEPSLYKQLATLYRRGNQFDRARAVLQQGLGPTGNHFSLQLELQDLEILPLKTNLDHAEAQLKKLQATPEEDRPDEGPTVEELAQLRLKLKKEIVSRESEIFRVKSERFPNEIVHRFELGMRLLLLEKYDEAIGEFQHARKDDKLKGKASLYLGICFRKRNNWKLAQRNFEEALQTLATGTDEPSRKETLYQLASGSADQGEYERALELGHELANLDFGYKNIGTMIEGWETKQTASN